MAVQAKQLEISQLEEELASVKRQLQITSQVACACAWTSLLASTQMSVTVMLIRPLVSVPRPRTNITGLWFKLLESRVTVVTPTLLISRLSKLIEHFELALFNRFTLRCGPTVKWKRFSASCREGRLLEVCREIVPDWRSSCAEGSVAEVAARSTNEKRTSFNLSESSGTGFGDEAPITWPEVKKFGIKRNKRQGTIFLLYSPYIHSFSCCIFEGKTRFLMSRDYRNGGSKTVCKCVCCGNYRSWESCSSLTTSCCRCCKTVTCRRVQLGLQRAPANIPRQML